MSLALAECPVCKTPISQTRFAQLQEQIRIEESEKLEKLRVELQLQSDAKVAEAVKVASERIAKGAAKQIALASASSEKLSRDLDEAKLHAKALEWTRWLHESFCPNVGAWHHAVHVASRCRLAAIVERPELACATHSAERQGSDSKPATQIVRANIQI